MTRKALILGATGGIGGAVAQALFDRGWQITALARDPAKGADRPHYTWVQGDAMNSSDVTTAAQGAEVIFHGVNPPGYRNWETTVLPMIDATITAARDTGARILLPGTVYNYDAAKTPVLTETNPQNATSRKGKIRIDLEQRLRDAAPEVPSLILRAGDFFGPGVETGWLKQGMMPQKATTKRITKVAIGHGHSWAYVPDLAETFAKLLNVELAPFEALQFQGYFDQSGSDMIDAIRRATGNNRATKQFPWRVIKLLAPFNRFLREVSDISGTWHHPMRLDKTRLETLIGPEPHRPLEAAVAQSLGVGIGTDA